MKKLIVLLMSVFIFACSTQSAMFYDEEAPAKSASALKVAVLPIEKIDSSSGYIVDFLTKRDLEWVLGYTPKFELIDMDVTAEAFADLGDGISVEELEKDEIKEIGTELNADIVIAATVEEIRNPVFAFTFTLFSMRTGDVAPSKLKLVKYKDPRLTVLYEDFVKKLDQFVNNEMLELIGIAKQNYNIKRYDEAEKSFNKIKQLDPSFDEPYYYIGMINLNREDYNEALQNFNYLCERDTTGNVDYLDKKAQVFLRQKKYREAAIPTKKIVEIRNRVEDWLKLADLYSLANDLNSMEDAVATAIKIEPENEDAIYRYSVALFDNQKYDEAIVYLKKAVALFPEDDLIVNDLVAAYQNTGKIDQAITEYEAIVKKDKKNLNARLNLANMYLAAAKDAEKAKKTRTAKKYKSRAVKALNAVVKLDKTNGVVYTRLASLYLADKNYSKALKNAEKAAIFSLDNYAPFMILAQIQQAKGLEKYKAAAKFNSEIPKASGSKAETLANKRDEAKENAANLYRKAEENLVIALKKTDKPKIISIIEARQARLRELNERLESGF